MHLQVKDANQTRYEKILESLLNEIMKQFCFFFESFDKSEETHTNTEKNWKRNINENKKWGTLNKFASKSDCELH